MKRIFVIPFLLFSLFYSHAQTYKIFKGDTINRIDDKGNKQGLWRKYYETDTLFSEGVYKNGKHTGTFHTYHKNGKRQSTLIFRGQNEISLAELYTEEGKLMARGKYIEHVKDSVWIYYDLEENKNAIEFYQNGKKEGNWKLFYQNGKTSREVIYKQDKLNGPYKEFFESGSPKIKATMVNGEFEGVVTLYHPNGKIWQTGNYAAGLKQGNWSVYKEDGSIEKEEIYKDGDLKNPANDEK